MTCYPILYRLDEGNFTRGRKQTANPAKTTGFFGLKWLAGVYADGLWRGRSGNPGSDGQGKYPHGEFPVKFPPDISDL
jgi:hypothetical protein